MLITHSISIGRIVAGTGKNMIWAFGTATAGYLLEVFVFRRYFEFPTFLTSLVGTALAFFIGFNNNQAYGRWWEARIIWGGLVNDSRTWARHVLYYIKAGQPGGEELRSLQLRLIRRHIAFLYALKANLRRSDDTSYTDYLAGSDGERIGGHANIANAILSLQTAELDELQQSGRIDGFRFLELSRCLTAFCDGMGKSERIKNTVFPSTYTYYSRIFIWYLILSATISMSSELGLWAIFFGTLVGYIFLTIHVIGEALLNPFEATPTGIPLDQITRTIEINLLQMSGEEKVPPPVTPVNGEYVL